MASFAQESTTSQMDSVLCLPMIGQATEVAHDAGPMSYKLPVFSEGADTKAIQYLELVKSKKSDPGSPELQAQAASTYAEIASLNPALAKLCSEFSTILTGDCLSKKDAVECINQRGHSTETMEAAKTFAAKMRDLVLIKTEMKAATDLMMPLAEKEEAMKASFAQFIANHYIKIIAGVWIFILAMATIGLIRWRRNR